MTAYSLLEKHVNIDIALIRDTHEMDDHATHPIARLPHRLALLLLLTGNGPAAASRLASRSGSRTLGRVQIRFLGLFLICLAYSCFLMSVVGHADLVVTDDRGMRLGFSSPATRIVALAPNITELLYAAGAGGKLVGVARFSDYPEAAKSLPVIGDFSGIDLERVLALKPDLVIAWRSGNRANDVAKLETLGLRVFSLEAGHLNDVSRILRTLGVLAGTPIAAEQAASSYEKALVALREDRTGKIKVFYQIWNAPLMTVNADHMISDVVAHCGGSNIFSDVPALTPIVSWESVLVADPEVIIMSNSSLQGGPQMWRRYPNMRAVANKRIFEVPPDLIQRHTPRIIEGAKAICEILATRTRN